MTNRPPININQRAYQPLFISSLHTSLRLITSLALLTSIYNRPNPLATHSQQPAHWPKSDNQPTIASTPQPLIGQLATPHQQPSHRPKTDNRPSASFTHQQPTNKLTTLHQQPSHGLRLITLVLLLAHHLHMSSNQQRLIWIPVLIRILTLLLRNCPQVNMKRLKYQIWNRIPL